MSSVADRNNRTAMIAAVAGLLMLGLAFASAPLYRVFCQVTGYDGTPERAVSAPGADAAAGTIAVRFDGNVNEKLPWKFGPVQKSVRVVPGAQTQIFYQATNLSDRTITGQAAFNVSPSQVGKYFDKIQCFCFTEQTLKPGETAKMPVLFYVDPKLRDDPDVKDLDEITLSYTFYPVETPAERS
jgi:cytochrome c oxidase assembly protein subunit 11